MKKAELITHVKNVAEVNCKDISKKTVEAVINALSDVITIKLEDGEDVTIPNIGKLSVVDVAERKGVIQLGDRKGEQYTSPAHRSVRMRISKTLKDAVNQ